MDRVCSKYRSIQNCFANSAYQIHASNLYCTYFYFDGNCSVNSYNKIIEVSALRVDRRRYKWQPIELKDITKEYRSDEIITPALKNISLKIGTGEFVAIMGASGSGKTTLLNIIGCMDVPTSGTYLLDNEDLGGAKEKRLSSIRGKKISFVFQNFALIGDYTVLENVEIPLIKQPLSKAERKKRVLSALELVGISNLAKKKPSNISGGQKQRVAIARAIVCGAETILADEPTGALDSKTGNEIMRVFSELNNMGKTVILITHDKNVASYAKRLITIQDGRILSDEGI